MKIPTLRGYLSDDGMRITVFCPYCDDWHTHSSAYANEQKRQRKSHRAAHCHDDYPRRGSEGDDIDDKPTYHTGYYVAEWRAKDLREMARALRYNTKEWYAALPTPAERAAERKKDAPERT